MILKELITLTSQALGRCPIDETYLLLEFTLKKSKSWIISNQETSIKKTTINKLLKLTQRRLNGEPIAYLIGEREFYNSTFLVNRSTLIPRPETEILVDTALEKIRHLGKSRKFINILEIGTGSGCIPISIINSLKEADVQVNIVATDISKKAIKVAEKNYEQLIKNRFESIHNIEFINADIIDQDRLNDKEKFDLIISNPPYIPSARIRNLPDEVRMEPRKALDGGRDGMKIIRKLFIKTKQYSHIDTTYLIEIDSEYIPQLSKWLGENQIKFSIIKDQYAEERFIDASFIHQESQ
jgi:release factor glutamine methyltransferase